MVSHLHWLLQSGVADIECSQCYSDQEISPVSILAQELMTLSTNVQNPRLLVLYNVGFLKGVVYEQNIWYKRAKAETRINLKGSNGDTPSAPWRHYCQYAVHSISKISDTTQSVYPSHGCLWSMIWRLLSDFLMLFLEILPK